MRTQQFDLVLPCTDGTILPLQIHRAELERLGRVYLLPDDVYRICSNKCETHTLAQSLGIPVPQQIFAVDLDAVRCAAAQLGYPLVLKPVTSSSADNPLQRQKVRKARTADELEDLAAEMLSSGPLVVEQNFIGRGIGIEFLGHNGEILTAFQHERIHEPLDGGGSSYRRSAPLDRRMFEAVRRLAQTLRYTGVAMVEFKENRRTADWILIEINARFWGSLALSIAAGIDFPRHLYDMLVLGANQFPTTYNSNLYCRHWSSDLQWLLGNMKANRNDPTRLTKPLRFVASEVFNVLSCRERSDTLQFNDPAPAVADLAEFFRDKAFALIKNLTAFRWWMRNRAVRAIRKARSITFVCHGNICRSPFASRLMAGTIRSVTVYSSGCYPREGRRAPTIAVEAAVTFGVDLSSHRSTVIDQPSVDTTDLIFVFDRRNQKVLAENFAGLKSKVHYLGVLDSQSPLEIEDPHGASADEYRMCYARIERIIRHILPTLIT